MSALIAAVSLALSAMSPVPSSAAQDQPVGDTTQPAQTAVTSLDLRINPLVDLMMYVRWLAEQEDAAIPEVEGFADAVEAARQVGESLGGAGWGVFLGPCSTAETAADMQAICIELPERFTSRSGESYELRALSTQFAEGLAAAEAAYLTELWPERSQWLDRRRETISAALKPKEREIYAFVQEALAVTEPQPVIPIYLVHEAPWPGAMSYRSRSGGVCFVGVDAGEGSQLLESVIHESLHALDSTSATPDVFDQLRSALIDAGVPRDDDRIRDIPHMVMFVHAAETVRRFLDPEHVDYGEVEMFGRPGLYARDKSSVDAVRPAWRAHLNGEIDRAEAMRSIIEKATAKDD